MTYSRCRHHQGRRRCVCLPRCSCRKGRGEWRIHASEVHRRLRARAAQTKVITYPIPGRIERTIHGSGHPRGLKGNLTRPLLRRLPRRPSQSALTSPLRCRPRRLGRSAFAMPLLRCYPRGLQRGALAWLSLQCCPRLGRNILSIPLLQCCSWWRGRSALTSPLL